MDPETWILQRILRYKDAETWIRRHGSCRESILVDAKTWIGHMDPETWILQRILRYKDAETWIGDMDLAEDPWDTKMLRHESEDVDLLEDPEIHTAAELWIRQHGPCRGSWDTHGCWDMNPQTWILQRSLRHKDVETWIRRCGSCRGSILVDATAWIGDMTPAEDLEIRSVQKTQTYVLSTLFLWFVAAPGIGRLTSRIFCCCPPTHCLGLLAGIIFFKASKNARHGLDTAGPTWTQTLAKNVKPERGPNTGPTWTRPKMAQASCGPTWVQN